MFNIKNDEFITEEKNLHHFYQGMPQTFMLRYIEEKDCFIIIDGKGEVIPKDEVATICKGLINFINSDIRIVGGENDE